MYLITKEIHIKSAERKILRKLMSERKYILNTWYYVKTVLWQVVINILIDYTLAKRKYSTSIKRHYCITLISLGN